MRFVPALLCISLALTSARLRSTWDWDCRLLQAFVGKTAAAHVEVV